MLKVAKDNYDTYRHPTTKVLESHRVRLLATAAAAILLALLAGKSTAPSFSLMATAISVIAGFTFSALFSGHAIAIADLPGSKSPEDVDDRKRLDALDTNHKIRTKYFLALCILELAFLAALVVDFTLPSIVKDFTAVAYEKVHLSSMPLKTPSIHSVRDTLDLLKIATIWSLNSFAIFIFAECLYTFHRLSESILKIIEIRKLYLQRHSAEKR
ncbi:hypothetical protein AL036_16355 [Salipiger aestuarii]|uniref:hypothetical protein n=1 Tax=Salipiger aestuarii TaxID=568098 RepID=UPI00123ABACC|nr:hypothetical protein [Salipiger aestuarii]KAA8606021.1 hypothetical protein AL036_16355 [Salipiger aestuarii]